MVVVDKGLAEMEAVDSFLGFLGDLVVSVAGWVVVGSAVLRFVGLAVFDLDIIAGRLAAPEVVITPIVVRRDFSCAASGRLTRELAVPVVDILEGLLFSMSPVVVVVVVVVGPPCSLPLMPDFLPGRTGRVGGLLMLVPVVRTVIALMRAGVGVTDGLVAMGMGCEAVVATFFAS